MKQTNWKDIAELVGITAIVASLIFVGLQMKQSQEIALASQYHERYVTSKDFYTDRLQNDLLIENYGEVTIANYGQPDWFDREISMLEFGTRITYARVALLAFDNHHYQHSEGFLSDEAWEAQRNTLKRVLRTPIFQYALRAKEMYRESYLALCHQLIEEG